MDVQRLALSGSFARSLLRVAAKLRLAIVEKEKGNGGDAAYSTVNFIRVALACLF